MGTRTATSRAGVRTLEGGLSGSQSERLEAEDRLQASQVAEHHSLSRSTVWGPGPHAETWGLQFIS